MKKILIGIILILLLSCNVYGANESGVTRYQCEYDTTISHIANTNYVDSQLLAAMNDLSIDDKLLAGDIVLIPVMPEKHHIVSEGENLHYIAKLYGYDVKYLMEYNGISNPNKLEVEFVRLPLSNVEDKNLNSGESRSPKIVLSDRSVDSRISLAKPLDNWVISCPYGKKRGNSYHHGVDMATAYGDDIYATMDGVVERVGYSAVYGKMVLINHGGSVKTLYGHCSEILVDEGEDVKKSQTIAKIGSTGNSTGPHLHLELRVSGKTYDPMEYLNY